ncbi:MAG: type II toxin-antitoxin system RelE/ParE family toxin [SAR202 cluster bacterium]|nr:type II toxin-antitoxin system RelE/ParE family toxin [SAR202 cluster bacterium]
MRKLRVSPEARNDELEILEYIARDNLQAARRINNLIREKYRSLRDQPYLGRPRPDLMADARSLPAGNYAIIYTVSRDEVVILRVLDQRRDILPLFDTDL